MNCLCILTKIVLKVGHATQQGLESNSSPSFDAEPRSAPEHV